MDRERVAGQLELGPGDRSGPGALVTDAQRRQLFDRARQLDLGYADLLLVLQRVAGVASARFLPADCFDQVLRELEAEAARHPAAS